MDAYIGQIMAVSFDFTPRGWLPCDGRLLSVEQNETLFKLLGAQYGGDGRNTFALPNLQSRTPMGYTVDPSTLGDLAPMALSEAAGVEQVTLNGANLPAHTHAGTVQLGASTDVGSNPSPENAVPAKLISNDSEVPAYAAATVANVKMAPSRVEIAPAGANAPVNIRAPYLAINFIIAVQGLYPYSDE